MEIRYLLPSDDLHKISYVYEQSWKYAYKNIIPQEYLDSIPVGHWADRICRDGWNNLVAIENETIIGTSCLSKSRFARYGDHGEIISIYLLPEYMGKGYGKLLLDRAIDELRKLGHRDILLWVLAYNHRARRFYERYGFVPNGEKLQDNIGGRDLTEVMYVYQLH